MKTLAKIKNFKGVEVTSSDFRVDSEGVLYGNSVHGLTQFLTESPIQGTFDIHGNLVIDHYLVVGESTDKVVIKMPETYSSYLNRYQLNEVRFTYFRSDSPKGFHRPEWVTMTELTPKVLRREYAKDWVTSRCYDDIDYEWFTSYQPIHDYKSSLTEVRDSLNPYKDLEWLKPVTDVLEAQIRVDAGEGIPTSKFDAIPELTATYRWRTELEKYLISDKPLMMRTYDVKLKSDSSDDFYITDSYYRDVKVTESVTPLNVEDIMEDDSILDWRTLYPREYYQVHLYSGECVSMNEVIIKDDLSVRNLRSGKFLRR